MQWMVKEVINNNNNEFMKTKIQSGIIMRDASDRSYHPTYQYGTSSWIINIENNYRAITGVNVDLGDAKSQFSHRSELCRLIGSIRHIKNICRTYNVLEGSVEIGCDRL